jgi:quinol monooxygenase YgiN
MIIVIGAIVVRPEHREAALIAGREHSTRSRAEPGCIAHDCHVDAENPDRIVFVEKWADRAALRAHFRVPESGRFVGVMTAMALSAPVMDIFQAETTTV